ncbi:MAG TPA: MarR family transcriptional regulator [Longimicrobiales bacterium]|nr:MarR family transcriptional regulator [Longimicrobiales bacterium]
MEPLEPEGRQPSAPDIRTEIGQTRPFGSRGEELVVSILRTADEAHRFIVGVLAEEDLTDQQYNVLRILRGAGPGGLPTLAIGERMIERTPGVTRLIDRLLRKDFVERERDTEDRRRIVCRITDEGLAVLDRIQPRLDASVGRMEGALPDDVLSELGGALDMVRQALRTATPRPESDAASGSD